MIRDYSSSDWKAVCDVFDRSKPLELEIAGVGASFVPLVNDPNRITGFHESVIYVFEEAGKVIGFVGHNGGYIGWLFVDPDHLRRGVGRALLRHILVRIDGPVCLWVMKNNRPAMDLYTSEGFEIVEERDTNNGGLPCKALKLKLNRRSAA